MSVILRFVCKWVESQFEWKIINASVFGYAKMEKVNHESERELVLVCVCVCVCVWVCVCVHVMMMSVEKMLHSIFGVHAGGCGHRVLQLFVRPTEHLQSFHERQLHEGEAGEDDFSSSLPLFLPPSLPSPSFPLFKSVLIMRCRSWVVDVVPCGLSLPPYILCSTCCLCFGWEKKTRIIVSLKKKMFDFLFQTTNIWYVIAYS